ncbi:hypothetical protein Hanom_Chr12g01123461 [Helianthus anomalus]
MEIGAHVGIDWGLLETVGEDARARDIIGMDSPFSRLFQTTLEDSYRELTVEFISIYIPAASGGLRGGPGPCRARDHFSSGRAGV